VAPAANAPNGLETLLLPPAEVKALPNILLGLVVVLLPEVVCVWFEDEKEPNPKVDNDELLPKALGWPNVAPNSEFILLPPPIGELCPKTAPNGLLELMPGEPPENRLELLEKENIDPLALELNVLLPPLVPKPNDDPKLGGWNKVLLKSDVPPLLPPLLCPSLLLPNPNGLLAGSLFGCDLLSPPNESFHRFLF
jgi:hypothetical protein